MEEPFQQQPSIYLNTTGLPDFVNHRSLSYCVLGVRYLDFRCTAGAETKILLLKIFCYEIFLKYGILFSQVT